MKIENLNKNSLIYKEKDKCERIYFVKEGEV